ncbi:hypothetical protein ACHHYP_01151 [Achlya hypogyna]|uniref:Proline-rich protein PRCC n=1 Tax=Achlya hypogyna TaxID=1202772 RepID=A0A1V9Z9D6_ACHHY|nr:hypothetical protein ACHHYP_01151 [Achlya hypogyna]
MSLVADYGSDSDSSADEAPPVVAQATAAPSSACVEKAVPKKRTVLFLPPEIKRLLESKRALDSDDSDDDDDTLAKKRAKIEPREAPAPGILSFLPPPKIALPVRPPSPKTRQPTPEVQHPHLVPGACVLESKHKRPLQGKRARNKERQLERMLQQGNFDAVANKVVDVTGAAPDAWKPSNDGSMLFAADREAQVLAEMAGTETENGYVVASYRPSRLQRQRHQLNQLTFDAKLREFDLLDKKGLALKSKRETQAKYGW